jgi:murein DD-endopeptidase MepM/ murein hydrolase activator NlpD
MLRDTWKKIRPRWKLAVIMAAVLVVTSLLMVRSSQTHRFESESGDYLYIPRDTVPAPGTAALAATRAVDSSLAKPAPVHPSAVMAPPVASPFKPGDLIAATVPIQHSFFGSFLQDSYMRQLAGWTGIERLPELISVHLLRSLNWCLDMRRGLHSGDECRVVFRVVSPEEKAGRTDIPDDIEIKAIHYTCPHDKREFKICYFAPDTKRYGKFYFADGTMVEPQIEHAPLPDYLQITSLFGEKRAWKRHEGLDFKTPVNTPVYAPLPGVITRTNWHRRANGYCIELALDRQPYVMKFLHLDKALVQPGQTVAAGQLIASSGNSGHSTAPHLHYQINVGEKGPATDPLKFHQLHRVRLAESDLPAFRQVLAQYDALMQGPQPLASAPARPDSTRPH